MQKNTELFFSNKSSIEFPDLLENIIKYLSENYNELINKGGQNEKERLDSIIHQYLTDNRQSVKGMSQEETVKALYHECAEYSFLTKYFNFEIDKVESIEITSWDCVWIKYAGGKKEISDEHFFSPIHAKNVMNRLVHSDNAKPWVRGHLGKNIRITVNCGGGTLDDDVGISASIRFINPNHLTKMDLIRFGTLTPKMMDFLINAYRYGLSMLLAGETEAGKTTLMSIIMKEAVPDDSKLITIENTTREFDLIKRDPKTNEPLNCVVHLVTRDSDDEKQEIGEQTHLEYAMTFNPDYLCMAEVKGKEAFPTIEAAQTHPVIGTVQNKDAPTIPNRIVQLASLFCGNLSDKTLYALTVDSFPILFYAEKMKDGVRRVTEICECQLENDRPKAIPLWRFRTDYNEEVKGKIVVHGEFEKCENISSTLQKRLRNKGIEESMLQSFLKEGEP